MKPLLLFVGYSHEQVGRHALQQSIRHFNHMLPFYQLWRGMAIPVLGAFSNLWWHVISNGTPSPQPSPPVSGERE